MKRILIILFAGLTAFLSAGCSKTAPASESITTTGIYFDTVISVEIWGTTKDSLLTQCKDICQRYEQLFSRTIETSDVARINQAAGRPVEVDKETIALIEKGLYYGRLSDGAFDITIAPLSTLWDIGNNPGTIPDETKIEQAKSHVNYENVVIENNTVTLTDPNASIDLGGIAKGYIADQLKAFLLENGVKSGLINLGGNLVAIGDKPDGEKFNIGIQKPFDEQNAAITSVEISNQSVVSSGVYERYFEKDKKRYHHLLDPSTGFPYDNNLLQVTIISDSSVDGDALSTVCFGLGLEKGTALIEQQKGIRAIFVTDDYKLHYVNE